MSEKRMQIMRDASYLLPPPGGEVVRELLDRHAALLARHNALREAVAWERECESVRNWLRPFRHWPELAEAVDSYQAARAEVDRLIASQGSADCQGEG